MNPALTTPDPLRAMYAAPAAPPSILGPAAGTRDAGVVARELAGLFYSMMLSEMHKSVPENPYFAGHGQETFRTMWINEMGRHLASRRGDPLAGMILREIERDGRAVGEQR